MKNYLYLRPNMNSKGEVKISGLLDKAGYAMMAIWLGLGAVILLDVPLGPIGADHPDRFWIPVLGLCLMGGLLAFAPRRTISIVPSAQEVVISEGSEKKSLAFGDIEYFAALSTNPDIPVAPTSLYAHSAGQKHFLGKFRPRIGFLDKLREATGKEVRVSKG